MLKGPKTIRAVWTASDWDISLGEPRRQRDNNSAIMTTPEAARYLRKSESWLLRQSGISYKRGIPNTYKRKDLDDWFERNKFTPTVA